MKRRDLILSAAALCSTSAAALAAARRKEDEIKLWRNAFSAFEAIPDPGNFFADVEPRHYIPLENGVIPSIFIPQHPERGGPERISAEPKTKGCPIRSYETRCKNFP